MKKYPNTYDLQSLQVVGTRNDAISYSSNGFRSLSVYIVHHSFLPYLRILYQRFAIWTSMYINPTITKNTIIVIVIALLISNDDAAIF